MTQDTDHLRITGENVHLPAAERLSPSLAPCALPFAVMIQVFVLDHASVNLTAISIF